LLDLCDPRWSGAVRPASPALGRTRSSAVGEEVRARGASEATRRLDLQHAHPVAGGWLSRRARASGRRWHGLLGGGLERATVPGELHPEVRRPLHGPDQPMPNGQFPPASPSVRAHPGGVFWPAILVPSRRARLTRDAGDRAAAGRERSTPVAVPLRDRREGDYRADDTRCPWPGHRDHGRPATTPCFSKSPEPAAQSAVPT